MRSFLEVSRAGEHLPAPELMAVVRYFALGCALAVLKDSGANTAEIGLALRYALMDRTELPSEALRHHDNTLDYVVNPWELSVKAFGRDFQQFERILVFPRGSRGWGLALRIALSAQPGMNTRLYTPSLIHCGFEYRDLGMPTNAELHELEQAVQRAWAPAGVQVERFALKGLPVPFLGTQWEVGRWEASESELSNEIVQRLSALVPLLTGNREEAAVRMMSATSIAQRLRMRGYSYSEEQIATFYGALKAKGFVILSGLSGTGKTKLAQEFAAAIGLGEDHFLLEPVKPDWRDATGLLGYWNPVSGHYDAPRFLRFVLQATAAHLAGTMREQPAPAADSSLQRSVGLTEYVRRMLARPDELERCHRYHNTVARFQARRVWTDEDLNVLWVSPDNGIARLGTFVKALDVNRQVLVAATGILTDRGVSLVERLLHVQTLLGGSGAEGHQRARIIRSLAALEPAVVPGILDRTVTERTCSALGLPVQIPRQPERARWEGFVKAWEFLQTRAAEVLRELGQDADDAALRMAVLRLASEFDRHRISGMPVAALRATEHGRQSGSDASAAALSELPYLVVLDEMNLARVEYYLADLLSVLETGREADGFTRGAINLHSQLQAIELGDGTSIPRDLRLPPNLYIVGTVNMDETTFAFSPKVLDRAFTQEFRNIDLSGYPPAPSPDQGGDDDLDVAQLLADFTRQGRFARFDKQDVAVWAASRRHLIQALDELNGALADHDLGFGYRVVDEILAFVGGVAESPMAGALPEADAFDAAVLMKVLPKFHGPLHRMQAPLEAVLGWAGPKESPSYPRTYAKAERMLRRARDLGHCSFS